MLREGRPWKGAEAGVPWEPWRHGDVTCAPVSLRPLGPPERPLSPAPRSAPRAGATQQIDRKAHLHPRFFFLFFYEEKLNFVIAFAHIGNCFTCAFWVWKNNFYFVREQNFPLFFWYLSFVEFRGGNLLILFRVPKNGGVFNYNIIAATSRRTM